MKRKKTNILYATLILGYILLFQLSSFFTTNGFDFINQFKNIILLVLSFILYWQNRAKPFSLPIHVKIYFMILLIIILAEGICGLLSSAYGVLTGMFLLWVVSRYCDADFEKYFSRSIICVTFISTIPLVYYYIIYGYYARAEIIFDKSMQTFLFGYSFVYLLTQSMNQNRKNIPYIILCLLFLFWCNVFILQSKTSIFGMLSVMILVLIFNRKSLIHIIKRCKYIFIGGILFFSFSSLEIEIPTGIQQAVNKFTGQQIYDIGPSVREETYETRELIRKKTYKILDENFFLGSGFGNVEKSLISTRTGAKQAESQLYDILLEGGYSYLMAVCILFLPLLIISYKQFRFKYHHPDAYYVFYQTFMFIILCIGNEMFSSIAWIFIGTLIFKTNLFKQHDYKLQKL